MIVGCGTRCALACSYDCFSTVIRPPDDSAAFKNSAYSQSRAAPIPRFGSFCSERVLRVPNETSLRIDCSILRASMSRTIADIVRLRATGVCCCAMLMFAVDQKTNRQKRVQIGRAHV